MLTLTVECFFDIFFGLVVIPQPAPQEEDSAFASEGIGSEDISSSEPVSESDGMSDSGNPLTPDIAVSAR